MIDDPTWGAIIVGIACGLAAWAASRGQAKRRRSAGQPPAKPRPPGGGTRPSAIAPGQLDLPGSGASSPRPLAPMPRPITAFNPPPLPRPPQPVARPAAPKNVALDLDPGQFSTATDEQTKQQALAAGNLLRSAWFGRRDRIPPASDPRTLLIDRAMVGHGLLSPEELVEIHKVGEEMSQARPDFSDAYAAVDRAVAESQEERKRRKEQKKAEAAERKRLRAEAVARRRQTDIIFLGRGVSRGLADRRSNVEKLATSGLPVLATPADVAEAMKLAIPRLRWLAFHSDASPITHYVRFTVPKRSGGTRALFAPHHDLAATQQWILDQVLRKVPTHAAAHGFVPQRSTVTNATNHVKRDVVINADLTGFFPTITFPRVRGIFRELGYSPAVATIFALLCTECARRRVTYAGKDFHVATGPRALPQGACTSPALSNLGARRLDSRLSGIASKLGWSYTRYADDLTFSADGEPARKIGYLLARIRHIANDEGFAVNEKKTRVQKRNTAQSVTGIVVNDRPGVPRDLARRLRAILHRARTESLASQNRENRPNFEAWLGGMIAYIQMVNPRQAEPLREAFEAVRGQ